VLTDGTFRCYSKRVLLAACVLIVASNGCAADLPPDYNSPALPVPSIETMCAPPSKAMTRQIICVDPELKAQLQQRLDLTQRLWAQLNPGGRQLFYANAQRWGTNYGPACGVGAATQMPAPPMIVDCLRRSGAARNNDISAALQAATNGQSAPSLDYSGLKAEMAQARAASARASRARVLAGQLYVMSGRYFQSIEIPEGANLTNMVADLIGDDVLMYGSDYPHGESHFPESAGLVTAWNMDEERKRKLLWENAARFYSRARLG